MQQVDDTDVINFLLSTEIIPLCLRTMEIGSELSKTVATFIVQKILLDDVSWMQSTTAEQRLTVILEAFFLSSISIQSLINKNHDETHHLILRVP